MASSLPAVLSALPDFKLTEHPKLLHLFKRVTQLEQTESFLTLLKRSRLTPKQVNYLNLPWLDGLYQAYYSVTLATDASDVVPERKEEDDPPIDRLAFDLLILPKDYPTTMSYLLRQGLSPRAHLGFYTLRYRDDPLLEVAIRRGKLGTVKVLVDAGAQVDLRHAYREDHSSLEIFEYVVRRYLRDPWYKNNNERIEDLSKLREEIDPGSEVKDQPLPKTYPWMSTNEWTTRPKSREVRLEYLRVLNELIIDANHGDKMEDSCSLKRHSVDQEPS